MAHILLIDDDVNLTDFLREELEAHGHTVECLDRAEQGPDRLAGEHFDVVILDNIMPRMTGIEFLQPLRDRGVRVPVVLMTGYADSDTAIQALALGAFEYVVKPDDFQALVRELSRVIARALEIARPPHEVRVPGQGPAGPADGPKLVGNSKPMLDVYTRIGQFANLTDPVLVLGETGTGKELVAAAFHSFSGRKHGPFVVVDCTAIPENLFESELFGHEKDAFTGANKVSKGMFEHANGGTLFLDEIGDLPLDLQPKLLRVLQEHRIKRVKGEHPISVDVRVVSATNRDLRAAVRTGTFREDLFYRLEGVTLRLPPLRERMDDLPKLVDYFVARAAAAAGRPRPGVAAATLERLRAYHWPGNVRQLQRVVFRAFGLCRGSQILPSDLELPTDGPAEPSHTAEEEAIAAINKVIDWAWGTDDKDLWQRIHDLLEREVLRVALERLDGNQTKVAERLNLARLTVSKRLEKYGLK